MIFWTAVEKFGINKLSMYLPLRMLNKHPDTQDVIVLCTFKPHKKAKTLIDVLYTHPVKRYSLISTLKIKDIEQLHRDGTNHINVL